MTLLLIVRDWGLRPGEKRQTADSFVVNKPCQHRNEVTNWSIAQLLTDNWLVCGEIASNKNSHASQPTANNCEPSSNPSNKTFKDILQEETAVNFLEGNEFKAILLDYFEESVIFSVVYGLFINRFKLLGFNWLIKLPWQLRCPQTKQKSQQVSYFFFSGLRPRFSRLAALPLMCLGFACSNFAKKNKRMLAV